jgi:hypothetical protein
MFREIDAEYPISGKSSLLFYPTTSFPVISADNSQLGTYSTVKTTARNREIPRAFENKLLFPTRRVTSHILLVRGVFGLQQGETLGT